MDFNGSSARSRAIFGSLPVFTRFYMILKTFTRDWSRVQTELNTSEFEPLKQPILEEHMNHILGLTLALLLVAVGAWDQSSTTCTKEEQTAAHAQCSNSRRAEALPVRFVQLTEELSLNPTQVAQLQAVFHDCQHACSALTAQFAPLMDEIRTLKAAANPDRQAIQAKTMELKALKQQHASELAEHRANLVTKIKAVLTPAQADKFDHIQSDVLDDELAIVAAK
jgi:Spy/CpxP family protein refolding chaperone